MRIHSNADASPAGPAGVWRWMFWAGFAVSAFLMVAASRGDLAIDEVISLEKAESAGTWVGLVTQNPNDNNHLLNTFFLRLLGRQKHLLVYRLPAVGFGIATLAALALTARRWGKTVPVWVVWLAGLSCPMILYSSEARGYAPAMFFAVASFEWLQRCRERCTWPGRLLFWALLCLGFLAHFSFGLFCVALGLWSVVHEKLAGISWPAVAVNVAKYYAVPALFIVGVYLVYIRHMIILGGQEYTRWEVAGAGAAYALGLADVPAGHWVGVLAAAVLVGWGILALLRQARDEWVFFIVLLVILPALVLVVHPRFLYFRYFLVAFPFFYLLVAMMFARWFREGGSILKLVPVLLVVAITAGHLVKVDALLRFGRGNYRRALADMAAATTGPVIRVGSDSDFRNATLLNFYARFLPPGKKVDYIPQDKRNQDPPDWMIVNCLDPAFPAYPDLEVGRIGKYNLFGVYPFGGLSGWSWFVYWRPSSAASPANRPPASKTAGI